MGQFINILIVLGSLGGIVFILYRKIPLLLALPAEEVKMKDFVKRGIRKIVSAQKVKPTKMLDSTLSKARSLARLAARQASQTETQTAQWLERLYKKSEQRKEEFQESYWDQLRKKKK